MSTDRLTAPPDVDLPEGSAQVAPDCRGLNFFLIDSALQDLLHLYLPPALGKHLDPHLYRLGELAGGRLDELAELADRHPPVLHARDRFGRDQEWIEYHPAYREMESLAFGELGLHAMSHRAGVLGWHEPLPPVAKYALQYLFVQAEFGLLCPVSVTDTSAFLIAKYASASLKARLLPRMLSQDCDELWKGAQFMTEKAGGSDVGAIETRAVHDGSDWWLWGEKWFCSHADGDLALLLARPVGAPEGTRGLGLFAMPRHLEDGGRNRYRIVRLKNKLGTRSMASGEIRLEGALAYPVGRLDRGFKQMMDQVNLSRLSHGARAAGMMRRCWNEALQVARHRVAFGRLLVEQPLMRRQLLELLVPTEQALSMVLYTADCAGRAAAGETEAESLLRILTPLVKLRACRDNLGVATGSMEVRGGNGYIEDWVNARLVRDAHIGVVWEGTSNIVALDAVLRAAGKLEAHRVLAAALHRLLADADRLPEALAGRLGTAVDRAAGAVSEAASEGEEWSARRAAGSLYHATSAVLLAWEGARLGAEGRDARRLLLARLVLDLRLEAEDPLAPRGPGASSAMLDLLLGERPLTGSRAAELAAG